MPLGVAKVKAHKTINNTMGNAKIISLLKADLSWLQSNAKFHSLRKRIALLFSLKLSLIFLLAWIMQWRLIQMQVYPERLAAVFLRDNGKVHTQ